MEISTDMKKIKESKCFGIAWDGDVKECKICEVSNICKQKTLGETKQVPTTKPAKPATKKAEESETVSTMKPANPRPEPKSNESAGEKKSAKPTATKKAESKKAEASYDSEMPDFKPMSVEELLELAKERGLNPAEFDKYTHTNIKKMRVTMALKKTYELK